MRYAIIRTQCGETWGTSCNGTDEEIAKYFLGQVFNIGSEEDALVVVQSVTIDGKEYSLDKQKQYTARFIGRKIGACGSFYEIAAIATGRNKEEARLSLYDRFEHIRRLELVEITEEGE